MQIAKESIFLSCIRYLCNAFFAVVGIFLAIGLFIAGSSFLMGPKLGQAYKSEIILAPDENGNDTLLPDTTPVILKINIHGVIGTLKLNSETIEKILLNSRKGMLKGDRVKGIMLHFDTPGGAATDSDTIYRKILAYGKRYKTPIYGYVDGLCASGGIMVSCAAEKNYSSPSAVIGSVGVRVGPFFNFKDLMTKYGVNALTITQGKDKDMLNPYRQWKEDEDVSIKNIVRYEYNRFVDLVVKHKPRMNKDKLINQYGAQIFDPVTAQEYGYIDVAGVGYDEALKELTVAAGIKENQDYQVVEIAIRPSLFTELLDAKTQLFNKFHSLYNPLNLREPSKARILYYSDF